MNTNRFPNWLKIGWDEAKRIHDRNGGRKPLYEENKHKDEKVWKQLEERIKKDLGF